MRVLIWQQFCSNHSADFTLVGVFKSPEEARSAAEELGKIVTSIARWYQAPENADFIKAQYDLYGPDGLLPPAFRPEQAITEQYGIDWPRTIDWLPDMQVAENVITVYEHVVIFDRDVIPRPAFGPQPFDVLIEKLGGEAFVDEPQFVGSTFWISLTFTAPNEATALEIQQVYTAAQDSDRLDSVRSGLPSGFWFAGEILGEGLHWEIQVEEIYELAKDLPAMIDYLASKGCTEITYRFLTGKPWR